MQCFKCKTLWQQAFSARISETLTRFVTFVTDSRSIAQIVLYRIMMSARTSIQRMKCLDFVLSPQDNSFPKRDG